MTIEEMRKMAEDIKNRPRYKERSLSVNDYNPIELPDSAGVSKGTSVFREARLRPESFAPKNWSEASFMQKMGATSAEAIHSMFGPKKEKKMSGREYLASLPAHEQFRYKGGDFSDVEVTMDDPYKKEFWEKTFSLKGRGEKAGLKAGIRAGSWATNPMQWVAGARQALGVTEEGKKDWWQEQVDKAEKKQEITVGNFITGLTGGLISPEEIPKEDLNWGDKLMGKLALFGGMAVGIGKVKKGLEMAISSKPGMVRQFAKHPRVYKHAVNTLSFMTYGQLNPQLGLQVKERLSQAGSDAVFAQVFGKLGVMKVKVRVPLGFGLGAGLAKLDGASNEDAVIDGAALAFFLAIGPKAGLTKVRTQRILTKEAKNVMADKKSSPKVKAVAEKVLADQPKVEEMKLDTNVAKAKQELVDLLKGEKGEKGYKGDVISAKKVAKIKTGEMKDTKQFKEETTKKISDKESLKIIDKYFKTERSPEWVEAEINKRVEAFRKDAGLMASKEGAGVRQREVVDATGGHEFMAKSFKLSRAKKDMQKRAEDSREYVKKLLSENDPKFKKLVEKTEKMKEEKIEPEINIDKLFESIITDKVKVVNGEMRIKSDNKYLGRINMEVQVGKSARAKQNFREVIGHNYEEIEHLMGRAPKFSDIIELAKGKKGLQKADVLTIGEQTEMGQKMVATSKRIEGLNEKIRKETDPKKKVKMIKEMTELEEVFAPVSSMWGRYLGWLSKIAKEQRGESTPSGIISKVERHLKEAGINTKKMKERAAKVNWNDSNEVIKFYRSYVKSTLSERINAYRFANTLLSPRTHMRNAFYGGMQTFIYRPLEHFLEGVEGELIRDFSWKNMKKMSLPEGTRRVINYYKGTFRAFDNAEKAMKESLSGAGTFSKENLRYLPSGKFMKHYAVGPRAMEAGDKYVSTLIRGGEMEVYKKMGVLSKKNKAGYEKIAEEKAEYLLGRKDFDVENKTGQGHVLQVIDAFATMINFPVTIKKNVWRPLRLPALFLKTLFQIAKISLENSPMGITTLWGNRQKGEQINKILIGSVVTAYFARKAVKGETEYLPPDDKEAADKWWASGKRPCSFYNEFTKTYIPMVYLGSLSYSAIIPAIIYHYQKKDPKSMAEGKLKQIEMTGLALTRALAELVPADSMKIFTNLSSDRAGYTVGKTTADISSQFTPASSMINYITTILDPIKRQAVGTLERIERRLPGISKYLKPYTAPAYDKEGKPIMEKKGTGEEQKTAPAKRDWTSWVLPYDLGQSREAQEKAYEEYLEDMFKTATEAKSKRESDEEKEREELREKGWMK